MSYSAMYNLQFVCMPRTATELAPEDPEIAFNLAAVLEACELLYSLCSAQGMLIRFEL